MSKPLPQPLIDSLQNVPGFEETSFVAIHQSGQQVTSVRFNPAKVKDGEANAHTFKKISGTNGETRVEQEIIPWCKEGRYLSERPSFTLDPLFHAGAFYVQEASSMFLDYALRFLYKDVEAPNHVLDLCAAPGGKSTLLAAALPKSFIVSNEVIKNRVTILAENISKWGSSHVAVTHNDPADFKKLPGFFDLLVVDAPCSGSGLFRKHPDAIDEWSEANVLHCSMRQQRILTDAANAAPPTGKIFIILLGLIIGSVSFAGSMIAYGKLNGSIKDFSFKGQQSFNIALLALIVLLAGYMLFHAANLNIIVFYVLFALALLYGVFFVLPIGGADMPVVISLLNSFTGVAAACGGFLYNNQVMLTGGILVGAAGTLLTILMCKAMNRSLWNVLLGSFGGNNVAAAGEIGGTYKEISNNDAAVVMSYASKVMIVPGYGLAVAQAQHVCHELEKILEEKGVDVKYAIHPVAGRMPGHMNVLLAEADVDYERLLEMEQANEEFKSADVVLILGANDVVNPAAKTDPASPIYGMPILEVEQSKLVIVNKRSMKPGYAGIENMLFFQPKTSMLFGDAKGVLQKLVAEIKAL